jgi:hypothetical protein
MAERGACGTWSQLESFHHRNGGSEAALSIQIQWGNSVDAIQKRMEYPEMVIQSRRRLSPAKLPFSHVRAHIKIAQQRRSMVPIYYVLK